MAKITLPLIQGYAIGSSLLLLRCPSRLRLFRSFLILGCVIALAACSLQRSQDAAEAKHKMRGMSKEQVLICMGPPKQKAHVGETEVWSYASTDGYGYSYGDKRRYGKDLLNYGEHKREFCTVNVVMKNEVVAAVHYNGPTGGLFDSDEQCAYAIEHCVKAD